MSILRTLLWTFWISVLCLESSQALSNLRRCADEKCQQVVSEGRTILRYHAKSPEMLSFNSDLPVKILSKEAGQDLDLWGVEIQGRRGYVNKRHIQETKVLVRELTYEVSTDDSPEVSLPEPSSEQTPSANVANDSDPVPSAPTPLAGESSSSSPSAEIVSSISSSEMMPPSMGAHASQMSLSAEDMEFERIKSTYANANGDFVLDVGSMATQSPVWASTSTGLPSLASMSLFSSVSADTVPTEAAQANYDVVDGTTIFYDEPVPSINQEPIKSVQTEAPEIKPTQTVSEMSEKSQPPPDVKSSLSSQDVETPSKEAENGQSTTPPKVDQSQTSESPPLQDDSPAPPATPALDNLQEQIKPSATPNEIPVHEHDLEEKEQASLDTEPGVEEAQQDDEDEADVEEDEENEIVIEKRKQFIESQLRDEEKVSGSEIPFEDKARLEQEDAERLQLEKDQIENIQKQLHASNAKLEPTTTPKLGIDDELLLADNVHAEKQPIPEGEKLPPISTDINDEGPKAPSSTIPEQKDEFSGASDEKGPSLVHQDKVFHVEEQSGMTQSLETDKDSKESREKSAHDQSLSNDQETEPDAQLESQSISELQDEKTEIPVAQEENLDLANPQELNPNIPGSQEDKQSIQEPQENSLGVPEVPTKFPSIQESPEESVEVSETPNEDPSFHETPEEKDPSTSEATKANLDATGSPKSWEGIPDAEDVPDVQQKPSATDGNEEPSEISEAPAESSPFDPQEEIKEEVEPAEESGGFFGSIFGSSQASTASPNIVPNEENSNGMEVSELEKQHSNELNTDPQTNHDQVDVPIVPEDYEVPNSLNYEEIRFHDPNEYSTEGPKDAINEDTNDQSSSPGGVQETTEIPEPDYGSNLWGAESTDETTTTATTTTPSPKSVNEEVSAQVQPMDDGTSGSQEEYNPSQQDPVNEMESKGDFAETVDHYIQESNTFLPEFLTSFMSHQGSSSGPSTNLIIMTLVLVLLFVVLYATALIMERTSNEGPLKAKLASMEKELSQVRNESLVIKREAETALKNGGISGDALAEPIKIVTNEPPAELLDELVAIREEMARSQEKVMELQSEKDIAVKEKAKIEEEFANLQLMYDRAQQELAESESIVQECLDEKKRNQGKGGLDIDITTAIDTLRRQLSSQQEAVGKYEAKIKKRESELKEKTQELRKQRADTANAKLQLTKMTQERDELAKKVSSSEEFSEENIKLKAELEDLKQSLYRIKEECENKDSDLETKSTEIEVLQLTVEQLKALTVSTSNNNQKSSKMQGNGDEDNDNEGDGWDCEDPLVDSEIDLVPDFNAIQDMAQLQVDLRKAQAACEKLSEQLVQAETAKEDFEKQLLDQKQELEIARKSKENSLKEKTELAKKLEVLTNYFNQREGELQKQLGMTANRLNDTEFSSQSASKQIMLLQNEVDSYQSQLKTLRAEMEEQERSLKAQNANLEKKQHESWVTVRQESRRSAEAQSELQTLRTRLTTVESKMVEKEFEISQLQEENMSLKETIEKISRSSQPKHEPGAIKGNKVVSFALENGNNNNGKCLESLDSDFDLLLASPTSNFPTKKKSDQKKPSSLNLSSLTPELADILIDKPDHCMAIQSNSNESEKVTPNECYGKPTSTVNLNIGKQYRSKSVDQIKRQITYHLDQKQTKPSPAMVYTNGNGSSASSTHNDPHGGASGGPASLPDLPPLPMLPTMMTMTAAPQPPPYMPYIPPDVRPAPLGRRSPGPRGYSPSPPHSDDYYPSPTGSASRYRRDSSRSPERAPPRNRYERYSRDRISPDRMSNRSGRSDRSMRYD